MLLKVKNVAGTSSKGSKGARERLCRPMARSHVGTLVRRIPVQHRTDWVVNWVQLMVTTPWSENFPLQDIKFPHGGSSGVENGLNNLGWETWVYERCTEKPVSSMAESGTIADIHVSVRQITQQSLVSRWYEMRARSSQNLLSSDWTLASKIVGRGGWKARHLSLTRTPALFPLFFGIGSVPRLRSPTKGSDVVSVNNPPAFRTQSPVCVARRRNQCLKRVSIIDSLLTTSNT